MQIDVTLSNTLSLLLNPFNIFYNSYDSHIIFYLKDHPSFEAVEAMIQEENSKNPIIRVIITKHDKTQVDHINDLTKLYEFKGNNTKRDIHFTPIEFLKTQDSGKIYVYIRFMTYKGQELIINFKTVSKATNKHCRLIDPEGHSADTSFPIMYPELNTIAAPESYVSIDGKKYKSPVRIWVPLFFKAVHGYYSEQFQMGTIRAGDENIKLIKAPTCIAAGESWIYEAIYGDLKYDIIETTGNSIKIKGKNEIIKLVNSNQGFVLKEIEYQHSTRVGNLSSLHIEFNPFIPICQSCGYIDESSSDFSISINQHLSLVTGKIKTFNHNNKAMLLLKNDQPSWAVKRAALISILANDNIFNIETSIIKDPFIFTKRSLD